MIAFILRWWRPEPGIVQAYERIWKLPVIRPTRPE